MPTLDLNPQFAHALDLMENTRKNVFVTGRAGTGKSTLLTYFRENTNKNVVVLAPTGVAAVNVKGQTIHSFFGFKPDITVAKVRKLTPVGKGDLYRKLDTIVIDEISMVRADLLDCIETFLRIHGPDGSRPFGGVQMIMIGDLYQLPPVVAPDEREIFSEHYDSAYFFSAHVFAPEQSLFNDAYEFPLELAELDKIYRQKDHSFIELLNAVRDNTVTNEHVARLNERHEPTYHRRGREYAIFLTTTNALAMRMNEEELARLPGDLRTYRSRVQGEFDAKYLPTDMELHLKIGAQVMMLSNDTQGRWINGTIGKIVSVTVDEDTKDDILGIELESGEVVAVRPHQWDIYRFAYNPKASQIESNAVGSCIQYPVKLAWAVTIHKSQGKTFERVVIDIGSGTFSSGQLYVALSRCTNFEGIVLKRPVAKRHIWTDETVVNFMNTFRARMSEASAL